MARREITKRFKQLASPIMRATAHRDGWRVADHYKGRYLLAYKGELVAKVESIGGSLAVTMI